jgi:hypothetical protein
MAESSNSSRQAVDERRLIRSQMLLGSGLITFGALIIPLFQVSGVLDGEIATAAFGIATAVIGAGAAMLPTGAAASASARILRSLPDQDAEADSQRHPDAPAGGQQNGKPGTATSSLQAATPQGQRPRR